MNYYFYNTDAQSLVGPPRFHKLIDHGIAAASGPRRGTQFRQLEPGDILLMYHDGTGIVAVGKVLERWDGKPHKDILYYRRGDDMDKEGHEWRVAVKWFRDFSKSPIEVAEIKTCLGYAPRGSLRVIRKRRREVERMLDDLRSLPPPTREAADLSEPSPKRAQVTISRAVRDTELARHVKFLHDYECQICGETIDLPDGGRYAEAHHVRPLGSPHDGPDVIGNIVCVCPNHHAQLDFGAIRLNLGTLRLCKGHPIEPKYVKYHNRSVFGKSSNASVD
jgi:hypothetical protein